MRRIAALGLAGILMAAPAAAQDAQDHSQHTDTIVPSAATLLEGYGGGGFAITTDVPEAQAFFSNGLELGAAFAHSAAIEAMKEAVRLDDACGMCKWGEALVSGPTINYPKSEAERRTLYALAREARRQVRRAGTARERALTQALMHRYAPGATRTRDRAYLRAMQQVQARWPEDNEIAVLTADAMMVAALVDYPDVDRALNVAAIPLLEGVLARSPDHTPAIHFYIHATELLGEPGKAEPYADRLEALAPRASHLVHMPSHTWYWVGRYRDAARTNLRAVEIGKDNARRLGLAEPDGVWGLPYHSHNVIYGLGGALMAEDAETALELARPLVEVSAGRESGDPVTQLMASLGYQALARFDPAGVAALAEPKLPYLQAAWRYARGEAAAAAGDAAAVRAELDAIPEAVPGTEGELLRAPGQMLLIARAVLAGRIAMLEGDPLAAAEHFRRAAEIEETPEFSNFQDPPAFWYPVRRDLAAALLAAGDVAGARREAEASLKLRIKDPVAEALLARIASAAR